MLNIGLILSSFGIVLIAELGDKTQLVAFSLTTTTRRPVVVFTATSLALVLSSVLASMLGNAASRVIPNYINYVSAGLFIIFGLYIIFSKDPTPLKEAFLNSIAVEKSCIRLMKKELLGDSRLGEKLTEIQDEEYSHYQTFKLLLKEKDLFRTRLNETEELREISGRLQPCRSEKQQNVRDILNQLIDREQANIDFFRLLLDHIDETHGKSEEVAHTLRRMIFEEQEHVRNYLALLEVVDE